MKRLIVFSAFLSFYSIVGAQSYFTAAGIRVGDGIGVTLQQRIAKKVTVEGILKNNNKRDEFMITGMIQRHVPLISRRLNFYTGAGLHKGFINVSDTDRQFDDPFGVTVIGGLEFTIGRINLSYDFKPAINITGGEKTFYPETALSLRYVLVKDKFYKDIAKNQKKKKRKKARDKRKKNREGIFNGKIFGN